MSLIPIIGYQVHLAQIPGHVKLLSACLNINLEAEPGRWYEAKHLPQEVLSILRSHAPEIFEELQSGQRAVRLACGGKAPGITMSKEPPKNDEQEGSEASSAVQEGSATESEEEEEVQHADSALDLGDDKPAADEMNPTLEEAALFCWESLFCPDEMQPSPAQIFWPCEQVGRASALFAKILHDTWEPFFQPSEVEGNVADDPNLAALFNSFCQVH